MNKANWPIRVGGVYRTTSSPYSRRVVTIDGDTIHSVWDDDGKPSIPEDQSPIPALVEALEWCVKHLDQIAEEKYPDATPSEREFNSAMNGRIALAKAKEGIHA